MAVCAESVRFGDHCSRGRIALSPAAGLQWLGFLSPLGSGQRAVTAHAGISAIGQGTRLLESSPVSGNRARTYHAASYVLRCVSNNCYTPCPNRQREAAASKPEAQNLATFSKGGYCWRRGAGVCIEGCRPREGAGEVAPTLARL